MLGPQPVDELPGVMLDVPDAFNLQIHFFVRLPGEPGLSVQVKPRDPFFNLLLAEFEVFQDLALRIGLSDLRLDVGGIFGAQELVRGPVFGPGREALFVILQVKVRVEQDMERDMPELVLGLRVGPQGLRTSLHRPLQHLQGCVILALDDFLDVIFFIHV